MLFDKPKSKYSFEIKRYLGILSAVWTAIIIFSAAWNTIHLKQQILELAIIEARVAFTKDVIYRRWNALHGGVYVPKTTATPGNPYLGDIPERDITTQSGRKLTMINPAYMTRQSHELLQQEEGILGHITSLNPIRPENKADSWEAKALTEFAQGKKEVYSLDRINNKEYMRLMRPLVTEKSCLQCHARQGYQEGNIQGGISAAIPMGPLRAIEQSRITGLTAGHLLLWCVGLAGLFFSGRQLQRRETALQQTAVELRESNTKLLEEITERKRVEEEREKLVRELQEALAKVKQLSGLLPICASCKKIKDDKGYWNQIEAYISEKSEAEFTHGLCPDCAKKYYDDIRRQYKKEK